MRKYGPLKGTPRRRTPQGEALRRWKKKFGQLPPDDLRCRQVRRNGKRCRKLAVKGGHFCKSHNGKARRDRSPVRTDHLPVFYSKKLKGTLSAFVSECLELPPTEQLNLYAELAMLRDLAGRAAGIYEGVCDVEMPDPMKKLGAIMAAGTVMKDALCTVADVASKISAMESKATDKVSAHQLAFVVAQIVRIMYAELKDEDARRVEATIRSKIRLAGGPEGTTRTPDQDAIEMDETIPRVEVAHEEDATDPDAGDVVLGAGAEATA